MKLTSRQIYGMRRIAEGCPISPDLARQLIRKGLANKHYVYERTEWNRTTARLWCCCLTEAGRSEADKILAAREYGPSRKDMV